MERHEGQKVVIAYNPDGHAGIILAAKPGTVAWREMNNQGASVHEHLFITEEMHEQWSAWGESSLAVWEGTIVEPLAEEESEVEWQGTFRPAETEDLVEFGLPWPVRRDFLDG